MANGYSRQGKPQTGMLAAENTHRNSEHQGPLTIPATLKRAVPERDFSDVTAGAGEGTQNKTKQNKPTGIKTGIPADAVGKKINRLRA